MLRVDTSGAMTLRGASTAIFRLTALSAPLCSGDQAHNLILLRQFPDDPVQFHDTIAQSDVLQPIKRREGCGRLVVVYRTRGSGQWDCGGQASVSSEELSSE